MNNHKNSLSIRLQVELPINEKDAKRRGIDSRLSRLLISQLDKEITFLEVENMLNAWKPEGKSIVVKAINEIKSLVDKSLYLEGLKNPDQIVVLKDDGLAKILSEWEAEAHAVFFAYDSDIKTIVTEMAETEPKPRAFSRPGYELPFLRLAHRIDTIIFLESSRMSLEVFGEKEPLLALFDIIRKK